MVTVRALYKFMESGPVKQILLGPAFSTVNKKIIPFATNLAIPQVKKIFISSYLLLPGSSVSKAFALISKGCGFDARSPNNSATEYLRMCSLDWVI